MKKINALIPARGGSKGVPRKNIKLLRGMPLIYYSIKSCLESNYIDRVIVSTEDEEIAQIAEKYGAEVPFLRPSKFAQDNSIDYVVLRHFFSEIISEEVAFIRPTTPMRDPETLDDAIETYYNNIRLLNATGLRSMHELPESPYKYFKINPEGFCVGFFEDFEGIRNYTNLPRQTFPTAYHPNGYIDIIKKSTVDNGSTYGEKIFPYITKTVIEIDTQEQFDLLESYKTEEQSKTR